MPLPSKAEDPCQVCRDRHLKCDDRLRCKQCERLNQVCVRDSGKHRWRHGSSAHYDRKFPSGQVWLGQTRNAKLQFIDQGPELENFYTNISDGVQSRDYSPTNDDDLVDTDGFTAVGANPSNTTSVAYYTPELQTTSALRTSQSIGSILNSPMHDRRREVTSLNPLTTTTQCQPLSLDNSHSRFHVPLGLPDQPITHSPNTTTFFLDGQNELKRRVYAEYRRIEDTMAAEVPPEELLSPAVWKEHFIWPNDWTTTQCACLMRYYVDHLGPWLDIGDPDRHFTLLVPQRARRCPPLLNAIFTIAARHLSGQSRYKTLEGVVQYRNNLLPRLDDQQAIKYQNASIAYLKELCKTPEHVQDEDLLAATIILRFYEELDLPLGDDTEETVMRPFQLFVAAQAKSPFAVEPAAINLDFGLPGTFTSMRTELETYVRGYQHSCFRIALRQECARAFMKQQIIGLSIESWSMLQGFDEADDIVWADRHLCHLANTLQFCFDKNKEGQWSSRRWQELKGFEKQWEDNKPISFASIHYKRPNLTAGIVLPEIWYLAEIHAAAMQYFDLARILLTVFNPTLPRLGPGATSASKQMSADVRDLVVELCGIARSMPDCEPALVQAYMAIALCGEHFTNKLEQDALLKILTDLEDRHGFPIGSTKETLKQAWA